MLLACSVTRALAIVQTGKLTAVDAAMSRNLRISFHGSRIDFPLADVDRLLAGTNDNPTFGNVREMCARDSYLRFFSLNKPVGTVLDSGPTAACSRCSPCSRLPRIGPPA